MAIDEIDELLRSDPSKIGKAIIQKPDAEKQRYLNEIISKSEDEDPDMRWRAVVALEV